MERAVFERYGAVKRCIFEPVKVFGSGWGFLFLICAKGTDGDGYSHVPACHHLCGYLCRFDFALWAGTMAGVFLSVASIRYGMKGIALVLAGILPQYLLLVPACIMLMNWCYKICTALYHPENLWISGMAPKTIFDAKGGAVACDYRSRNRWQRSGKLCQSGIAIWFFENVLKFRHYS